MKEFFKNLREEVEGDIYSDPITRAIYSVDASIYEMSPLGVVVPKTRNDLVKTLELAYFYKIPVTARGAATGITGSCLGTGLIIDTSKYLNQILKINIEEEYVICEPGVIQDRLNEHLAPYGYRLGPDTSTGNRATLGGMLANNSAGSRSLLYGCMVDHVQEVELALGNGELLSFKTINEQEWQQKRQLASSEGRIYQTIYNILTHYRSAILKSFPQIPRHVSGYNLDKLLMTPPLNVSQLIAGSEGTLGIATQIKMHIAKKPAYTGVFVIHVEDLIFSMNFIADMLAHQPIALEMIDHKILAAAKTSPTVRSKLNWLQGSPQAVFIAEFAATSESDLLEKIQKFSFSMRHLQIGYAYSTLTKSHEINHVWEVRKAGLGLLLSKRDYSRAIAFIEDISIAPAKLGSFLQEFSAYLQSIGKEAGIYGHVGSGCMHIRPYIDLRKKEELHMMEAILTHVSTMVLNHGGAMSGEHGDGLVRSWLNEKMFGKELYQAFKELKYAFDPENLMNPGKIINGPSPLTDLRLSPSSLNAPIPTFLDFSEEGGFNLSVDLCNGNGECRKKENLMCPSFQASNDEHHSTRARAQTLRSIIHGKLPLETLASNEVLGVLDLCIECKGCKKECPSQIDMAKMKSEILYQYQEKYGYSLRNRLFTSLSKLNRLPNFLNRFFYTLSETRLSKYLLSFMGITPERSIPKPAKECFSKWFYKQNQLSQPKKVMLFTDTYTEFYEPQIGKSAYKILNALGYEILLVQGFCCGRPYISKGFLKEAKTHASQLIEHLTTQLFPNMDLVILEPSCLSALKDDYRGLLGNSLQIEILNQFLSLEDFLHKHLKDHQLPLNFSDSKHQVYMHGHCHQKALFGMQKTLEILNAVDGFSVYEIPSGCCGMAGSFGYEKEHYAFSMKIGALSLFPHISKSDPNDLIVANGMSCRQQIKDGTKRQAIHLAEAIANKLIK